MIIKCEEQGIEAKLVMSNPGFGIQRVLFEYEGELVETTFEAYVTEENRQYVADFVPMVVNRYFREKRTAEHSKEMFRKMEEKECPSFLH